MKLKWLRNRSHMKQITISKNIKMERTTTDKNAKTEDNNTETRNSN